MAILLHEAKLLHKSILYATDINPSVVTKTKAGIMPMSLLKGYAENYRNAGGKEDFSKYYTAKYEQVIFNETLREKIVCSTHNLVSDSSFNEFQLILCRNVLIYFDKHLQNRVFRLFDTSLERLGFLAIGSKENLKFSDIHHKYKKLGTEKIWKKEK